jgi:hypothetical protein
MADSFAEDTPVEETPAAPGTDVEMVEGGEEAAADANGPSDLPFAEDGPEDAPAVPRTTFVQYLTSPSVTLLVGSGDSETVLTAHMALLTQSPFFAEACAEFVKDGSVSNLRSLTTRHQLHKRKCPPQLYMTDHSLFHRTAK